VFGTAAGCVIAAFYQSEGARLFGDGSGTLSSHGAVIKALWMSVSTGYTANTGDPTLDLLLSRGGMGSMLTTIWLIISAMCFGGVMEHTGFLRRIVITALSGVRGTTDARAVYDIDEAMRRAERYIRAGADGIFIEAPRSVAELERIGRAFDIPQVCNPLMGGHTPILTMDELHELGFDCAVLGLDTVMHAAKAVEAVLLDMKSGKFAMRNDGMDFEAYKKVVGYDLCVYSYQRHRPVHAGELSGRCQNRTGGQPRLVG
jgi:hypothetical protein